MKKFLLILAGMALTVGLLATAGYVYAQTGDTPDVDSEGDLPAEPPIFGGHGFFGGEWFRDGILGDYILPALADIFGFTDNQVDAFTTVKETMQDIHDEFTVDEIRDKMQQVFSSALDDAVADGAITQEQADLMLERQQQMGDRLNGRGMRRAKPLGERDGGILAPYMDAALVKALGISEEKFQEMKAEGFNLREYAADNDFSDEELAEMMVEVHTNAINAALADGVITQEQADFLLSAANKGGRLPFGPAPHEMHGDWNEGETE